MPWSDDDEHFLGHANAMRRDLDYDDLQATEMKSWAWIWDEYERGP
jgi:hypothetical protein